MMIISLKNAFVNNLQEKVIFYTGLACGMTVIYSQSHAIITFDKGTVR